jgi:hypothetical protein
VCSADMARIGRVRVSELRLVYAPVIVVDKVMVVDTFVLRRGQGSWYETGQRSGKGS